MWLFTSWHAASFVLKKFIPLHHFHLYTIIYAFVLLDTIISCKFKIIVWCKIVQIFCNVFLLFKLNHIITCWISNRVFLPVEIQHELSTDGFLFYLDLSYLVEILSMHCYSEHPVLSVPFVVSLKTPWSVLNRVCFFFRSWIPMGFHLVWQLANWLNCLLEKLVCWKGNFIMAPVNLIDLYRFCHM